MSYMSTSVTIDTDSNCYIFNCPHCNDTITVNCNELNCQIFRHGVFIATLEPINPHTSRDECDTLFNSGTVYGCCKPFRFDGVNVTVCEYI
jgi:hypothetical protein